MMLRYNTPEASVVIEKAYRKYRASIWFRLAGHLMIIPLLASLWWFYVDESNPALALASVVACACLIPILLIQSGSVIDSPFQIGRRAVTSDYNIMLSAAINGSSYCADLLRNHSAKGAPVMQTTRPSPPVLGALWEHHVGLTDLRNHRRMQETALRTLHLAVRDVYKWEKLDWSIMGRDEFHEAAQNALQTANVEAAIDGFLRASYAFHESYDRVT